MAWGVAPQLEPAIKPTSNIEVIVTLSVSTFIEALGIAVEFISNFSFVIYGREHPLEHRQCHALIIV